MTNFFSIDFCQKFRQNEALQFNFRLRCWNFWMLNNREMSENVNKLFTIFCASNGLTDFWKDRKIRQIIGVKIFDIFCIGRFDGFFR